MSSHSGKAASAEIVDMVSVLQEVARRRITVSVEHYGTATLLSIRQHLKHQGSVGYDDVGTLKNQCSKADIEAIDASLKQLLCAEFGYLRVHRNRELFVVSHQCRETLVAGLLRVQYHARQVISWRSLTSAGIKEVTGLPVSWGVGSNAVEAERDRRLQSKKNQ